MKKAAALNVSTERLIIMASDSQSDIIWAIKQFLSLLSSTRRDNERQGVHVLWLSKVISLSALVIATLLCAILYFMTNLASLHLFSRVVICHQHWMCFAISWWTLQPCIWTFRVNQFCLYYRGPRQNKHIQMMVQWEIYWLVSLRMFRFQLRNQAFCLLSWKRFLHGFFILNLV